MILDEILETKREEVAQLRARAPEFEARAQDARPARGFESAVRGRGAVSVIAEFKRRSPSEGDIQRFADAASVAKAYEAGGASALSVLTDRPWFGGSLDDLEAARAAVGLPVLRKDFVIDPVQVYEARAHGADAVLLIVAALRDSRLEELRELAESLGMAALVEAHDGSELDRAIGTGARVLGVNARDLRSFDVDVEGGLRHVSRIPADRVAVAESGISGEADVIRAGAAGADAVLVGGWLMKRDPEAGVRELAGHRCRPRALDGEARTAAEAIE